VREPGSGTRETVDRMLAAAEVPAVRPLLELDANAAMRAAVIAGVGPGALSVLSVRAEITAGQLVEIKVTGVDLRRNLRAVWAQGRQLLGAAEQLLRVALHGAPASAARAGEST
ncbi:MAG TPA: LysR substrate-binding domain-containing protein, partial [Pseudonocardia sp.]